MLPQEAMIERLRRLCVEDERLEAAMLYGSFTRHEGDRFSDIDCVLYFEDEALAGVDPVAWAGQIAPVMLYYINEFGNGVAIFDNLVRAEFHFDRASDIVQIKDWHGNVWFPSVEAALLLDRTGRLTEHLKVLVCEPPDHDTPEDVLFLCHSFLNWMLFGSNVLFRGEHARALEILHLIGDYLLRMARLLEGRSEHWITPTKALEQELSPSSYERYRACTAPLEVGSLRAAYLAGWEWGNELLTRLAQCHQLDLPGDLIHKLHQRLHRGPVALE
jgi:lincosamide nucleotidyltransferase B/F